VSNLVLGREYTAGANIARFRIVALSSADAVVQASLNTSPMIGASMDVAPLAGERVTIIHQGIASIEAGGAIAVGGLVTSDAQGRAIASSLGAGVNARIVGLALEPAVAAGDIIRVLLNPGPVQG
jgi:hypothetical protein